MIKSNSTVWIFVLTLVFIAVFVTTKLYTSPEPNLDYEILDSICPQGQILSTYFSSSGCLISSVANNKLSFYSGMPPNRLIQEILLPGRVISSAKLDIGKMYLLCNSKEEKYLLEVTKMQTNNHKWGITNTINVQFDKLLSTYDKNRIVGFDSENNSFLVYNNTGSIIQEKTINNWLVFSNKVQGTHIVACNKDSIVAFDPKDLSEIHIVSLPKSIEMSDVKPPNNLNDSFIINDIGYYFIDGNGILKSMKSLGYDLQLNTQRYLISNFIEYHHGSIRIPIPENYKLIPCNYDKKTTIGFSAIDVFCKWDSNTGQSQLILISTHREAGQRNMKYYIVNTQPFYDKIKAVFVACEESGYLIFMGEKGIYKSLQPEWWQHIEKVEIIE